ncbi:MAG: TetR/AcrR family transcriptional regulator [Chloroflexota bacterium]
MPKQIDDQTIYRATIDALLQHGYAGATTKLIATMADISEVTLFRKYGSKTQLVAAAVSHYAFQPGDDDVVYTGDVATDLFNIIQQYNLSSDTDSQLFPVLISELAHHPELREVLAETIASITRVGKLITRYQEEGVLRAEHPLHVMGALLGPLMLNRILRNALPEIAVPPVDFVEHIEQFLSGRLETNVVTASRSEGSQDG